MLKYNFSNNKPANWFKLKHDNGMMNTHATNSFEKYYNKVPKFLNRSQFKKIKMRVDSANAFEFTNKSTKIKHMLNAPGEECYFEFILVQ